VPQTPRARTVAELTDPYIWTLTPPPPVGDGVCEICHNAPGPGYARCWSCFNTMRQVSRPVSLVVPISLYRRSGQLHHVLWGYKNLDNQAAGTELRTRVAALLYRFFDEHGEHVQGAAGSAWDVITTVPSSRERGGSHPLERAISMAPPLRDSYERLLRRGEVETGHNQASDRGFEAATGVAGTRVLLVDDTFTSGARLQSAASALALAGATVLGAVVVGRFIDPSFSDETQALWDAATQRGFRFDTCCLEG